MNKHHILAVAVLLALPSAGLAQSANDDPAPSAPTSEVQAQQEKKICRTEKVTGSLTRRSRTCLTEAQWSRLEEGTRRNVENIVGDANLGQQAQINRGGQ